MKKALYQNIDFTAAIPFFLVHLVAFAAFWTGITKAAIILFFVLFWSRIFLATAVYHRYFSHKTYSTSRVMQFILAFLVQTTGQQGAIWWAEHHRKHHQYSDTEKDVHSPRHHGFWYSHLWWIFDKRNDSRGRLPYKNVNDWLKFPELVWLDKHHYVSPVLLAILSFLIAGWAGLVVGFFWSTIAVYHSTFMVNSLTHVFGSQRYLTADDSRNNWWIALLTFGEGWHNNHHYYQLSARQGFRWYEIDMTYYILKLMEKLGLIWDIKEPPESVLKGTYRLPQKVLNRSLELINEAGLSLEALSAKLSGLSESLKQCFERPNHYISDVSKELTLNLEQMSHSLKQKLHSVEEHLPLLLAKSVKEKFNHGIQVVEHAINAVKSKSQLMEASTALANLANMLELNQLVQRTKVATVSEVK